MACHIICFVSICFVSFCFVSFRFGLFRFVLIWSVSIRFVSFRFVSVSFCTTGALKSEYIGREHMPFSTFEKRGEWPGLCQTSLNGLKRGSGKEGTHALANFLEWHRFICAPDLREIQVQKHYASKLHWSIILKNWY